MLAPVRITAPTAQPVSLAEAKAHLRVDHDHEDATISALVASATSYLDGWSGILGRALVTQTWQQDMSELPGSGVVRLPLAPVRAVESILYRDPEGNMRNLAPDAYSAPLADGLGPFIRVRERPATSRADDAVSVIFSAGYGGPEDVPPALRQAILLLIGHWYRNREAVTEGAAVELPFSVSVLVAPFRRLSV